MGFCAYDNDTGWDTQYTEQAGRVIGIFFLIFLSAFLVLRICAAVRVSKAGGSGAGYFFLGWLYVACSGKANHWRGFDKTIAVVLGLLTGIGLDIYVLVVLKSDAFDDGIQGNGYSSSRGNSSGDIGGYTSKIGGVSHSMNDGFGSAPAQNSASANNKIALLKEMRAEGTITEEEYRELVKRELQK